MADPKRLSVVFEDYSITAYYTANTTQHHVGFYVYSDGSIGGNTQMKLEFANACSQLGYEPRSNYWAIQYADGEGQIEYANGHQNTTFSGNSHISDFIQLCEKWAVTIEDEFNEQVRLGSIPTWDDVRRIRDEKLSDSDGIFSYATEKSQTVPSEWITYRQALRDIPTTYGANTGNTELVVYPTKPSWPNW